MSLRLFIINVMVTNDDEYDSIEARLVVLREEHRDLDEAIHRLIEGPYVDQLRIRRMKKRKLQLKDQIQYLEDLLIPDEPA